MTNGMLNAIVTAALDPANCHATASSPSTSSTESPRSKRSWLDEDSSDESEPDQKRAKTRSLSPISTRRSSGGLSLIVPDRLPRLPETLDNFLNFCERPDIAFVDKTHCILQLPDKFRFLLLRPPRFGKTTFLSTLSQFYDLHGATLFDAQFGSLAVTAKGSDAVPPHSHHLCLSFRLSHISVNSEIAEITSELASEVSLVLGMFVIEYATELQISSPESFFVDQEDTREKKGSMEPCNMFAKVFQRVRDRGYSLFVGVDDYDTPTQMRSFAYLSYPAIHESFASPRDIEHLIDSSLWGPLLDGLDVIDKLFITGTLPAKYPALETLPMTPLPHFQLSCGFTEAESLHLARSILDETPDVAELGRLCGNYVFYFPNAETEAPVPLLHPQRLIDRLSELSQQHPRVDEDSFKLLMNILTLLPECSEVPRAASTDGLICLLAIGGMPVEGDTLAFDATAVTWNDLYHAGALTYDRPSGTLRVANSVALSLIHSHIDDVVSDRYALSWNFLGALSSYGTYNDPKLLLEMVSSILCDETRCCFGSAEPDLRGIMELVMRNKHCTRTDYPTDPIILLPANETRVYIPGYKKGTTHIWDLQTATLRGIWQAAHPNEVEPAVDALRQLHEELCAEDDEHLLARPYAMQSPTVDVMKIVSVGNFLDTEPEYPQLLAVGGARVLMRQHPSTLVRMEEEAANATL